MAILEVIVREMLGMTRCFFSVCLVKKTSPTVTSGGVLQGVVKKIGAHGKNACSCELGEW